MNDSLDCLDQSTESSDTVGIITLLELTFENIEYSVLLKSTLVEAQAGGGAGRPGVGAGVLEALAVPLTCSLCE